MKLSLHECVCDLDVRADLNDCFLVVIKWDGGTSSCMTYMEQVIQVRRGQFMSRLPCAAT